MTARWGRSVLALAGASLVASGCLSILGGDIEFRGSGGGTTTTTSTGGTGTGGTGTGGMPASCDSGVTCTQASDCTTGTTACVTADCTDGCCAVSNAASGTKCTDNGGKVCDGNGSCVACDQDSDCPATGTVCAVPKCDTTAHTCSNTDAAKGTACEGTGSVCDGNGNCVSSHCTDGVMDADETDVDCGGSCGATCTDTPQQKCAVAGDCKSGVCADNSGGTQLLCQVPTCTDGVKNGNETDKDCGGAGFMGAAACPTCATGKACTGNTDCTSTLCQSMVCTLKGDGNTCGGDTECNSGHCLTDDTNTSAKVCCHPTAGCTAGTAASCGNDGNCKHDGTACADYGTSTVCTAASCTDGANSSNATTAAMCDGSGSCKAGTTSSCGTYKCGGTVCKTSCTADTDCTMGNYCNGTACVAKITQGQPCSTNNQCGTGHCVDGVCCNTACIGKCQACKASLQNAGGTDGTCGAAKDGTDPHLSCPAQNPLVCGNTGTCTAGACTQVANGTPCGTTCVTGELFTSACNGTGACLGSGPFVCPGNYVCSGSACLTSCSSDSDCLSGSATPVCNTASHTCVTCTAANYSACSGFTPLCDATTNTCVQCNSDADCSGSTPACDTTSHTCVQCNQTADCNNATMACSSAHTCLLASGQTCSAGSQCASGTCCTGAGAPNASCTAAGCL